MDAQSQQGETSSSEFYTFVAQYNDEPPEATTLRPRNDQLNVAFGAPERRAAIWKVLVARKGEVYVMERSTGKYVKASLHKTGDWRVAWIDGNPTEHPVVAEVIEKKGRIIEQWQRPPAKLDGYTLAFSIVTSGDQLTEGSPESVPKRDMLWLQPPADNEIGAIVLAYMKPTGKPITLKGYLPLAVFMMETNEAVMVMAAKRLMKPEEADLFARHRSYLDNVRDGLVSAGKTDPWPKRAMFIASQTTSMKYLLDMRMSAPVV
jgi:hypothetical protein